MAREWTSGGGHTSSRLFRQKAEPWPLVAFPVKWPGARGRAEYFALGRAESIVREIRHAQKCSSLSARSSLNCLVEQNRSTFPNGRAESLDITNRRAESTYVPGWSSEAARACGLSSDSARQLENDGRTRARGNSRRAARWRSSPAGRRAARRSRGAGVLPELAQPERLPGAGTPRFACAEGQPRAR